MTNTYYINGQTEPATKKKETTGELIGDLVSALVAAVVSVAFRGYILMVAASSIHPDVPAVPAIGWGAGMGIALIPAAFTSLRKGAGK